jgi:AcrR family transcriptional regulator
VSGRDDRVDAVEHVARELDPVRGEVGVQVLRNFAGKRELLEALYLDEVDAVVAAAADLDLLGWVHRFMAFSRSKHPVAAELLKSASGSDPVFSFSRERVLAAGRPLLEAAQRAGEIRPDLTLEQVLDMVIAVSGIGGDAEYVEPILRAALDGLRPR